MQGQNVMLAAIVTGRKAAVSGLAIDRKECSRMSRVSRPRILRGMETGLRVLLIAGALGAVGATAHLSGLRLGLGSAQAARVVDCDCSGIGLEGGSLAMTRMRDCRAHQARLYSALSHGDFALHAREGRIAGGSVCLAQAAGPDAWPLVGAQMSPWLTFSD